MVDNAIIPSPTRSEGVRPTEMRDCLWVGSEFVSLWNIPSLRVGLGMR